MDSKPFSDATFSLFGIGQGGVPSLYRTAFERPGEAERLARVIVQEAKGKRVVPDYLRTLAQLLVEHYGRLGPLPDFVLEANAAALSLISPDTGEPRPAPGVRRIHGYPTGVRLEEFLDAAGRDGIALTLAFLSKEEEPLRLDELMAADWMLSIHALAEAVGVTRDSLRSYRAKPEYRRIAVEVGGWLLVAWGPERSMAGLSHKAIRDLVCALSRADVIEWVDSQPTIWSQLDRTGL